MAAQRSPSTLEDASPKKASGQPYVFTGFDSQAALTRARR